MSADYLNELKTHWKLYCLQNFGLSRPSNEQKSSDSNKIVEDNEGCQDSQLVGLEISSSLKLKDNDVDN
ncbi:unnamed protein product [Rhizophagus irregularis]|uniref:Uncharacterized protein n=1 Tax=Rhizophagus irregularis TaxID=588596 RepID=A0A915YQZ8_9GLOM|nr:unnamed protein product [Rhizophagus irregularis]